MKITVHVRANARAEEVKKSGNAECIVSVKEPPTEGMANDAIERLLAEYFDISRSRVRIVAGKTSKKKIVEVT